MTKRWLGGRWVEQDKNCPFFFNRGDCTKTKTYCEAPRCSQLPTEEDVVVETGKHWSEMANAGKWHTEEDVWHKINLATGKMGLKDGEEVRITIERIKEEEE